MRTPCQIYRDREEKKNLEFEIRDATRVHCLTLTNEDRLEVIKLRMDYRNKYKKEY